jgi:hypothetical protein
VIKARSFGWNGRVLLIFEWRIWRGSSLDDAIVMVAVIRKATSSALELLTNFFGEEFIEVFGNDRLAFQEAYAP